MNPLLLIVLSYLVASSVMRGLGTPKGTREQFIVALVLAVLATWLINGNHSIDALLYTLGAAVPPAVVIVVWKLFLQWRDSRNRARSITPSPDSVRSSRVDVEDPRSPEDISSSLVTKSQGRTHNRRTLAIAAGFILAAALLLPVVLAANGKAVLVWVDGSPERKLATLRGEFERLSPAARGSLYSECVAEGRNAFHWPEIWCADDLAKGSDDLFRWWVRRDPLRAVAELDPCVYLYGFQTMRQPRLEHTNVCTALVAVDARAVVGH